MTLQKGAPLSSIFSVDYNVSWFEMRLFSLICQVLQARKGCIKYVGIFCSFNNWVTWTNLQLKE